MTPEQFQQLANLLPEPMLLLSADTHIISANAAATTAMAQPVNSLAGKSLLDFVDESADKAREFLRNCAGSRQLVLGSLSLSGVDGNTVKYRCDGALLEAASDSSAAVILLRFQPKHILDNRFITLNRKIDELNREISERRRTEQALRENETILNGVINNSAALIYIKDLEGRYQLINEQFARVFHVDGEQIKDKNDFDIFSRQFAEQYHRHDLEVLHDGQAIHCEESAPLDDGLHQYISVKFPLQRSDGETYGVCGISTDITELKRAEQQVRELNNELEVRVQHRTAQLVMANEDLEAFSYSVSHDLRAPLRGIDGFSHILLDEYKQDLDETGKDYLNRICAATRRMGQLIDDILKLSRIGRNEIKRQEIDLSAAVREVIDNFREQEPQRHVEVNIQAGVHANADDKLVRIALENLLSNAWKYTGKQQNARIDFGLQQQLPEAVYFVRDNGVGFDPQYSEKLFTPFQRLHGKEFEGTGIGLATVNRVVHCHHGRIWAQSEIGQGTCFYFTLAD